MNFGNYNVGNYNVCRYNTKVNYIVVLEGCKFKEL